MKKYYLLLIASVIAGAAAMSAQGLSMRDRMHLRSLPRQIEFAQGLEPESANAMRVQSLRAAQGNRVGALARIADESALEELEAQGVVVHRLRHGFVGLDFPADVAESVASHPAIHSLSISRPVEQKLDYGRKASGIDKIHQGLELPQPYTGKGVICGIVDGGFDPNHANFRNEDGSSRIKTTTHYYMTASGGVSYQFYNPEDILKFTTDDPTTFHGTHTMGIMAGSYRGDATVATAGPANKGSVITQCANPYYGVAYDADIALGIGSAYEQLIAYNVDAILDYTAYCDYYKIGNGRSVINLSLGVNQGPHDGSSMLCQYLDEVAKQDNAIICLAAGNEGDLPISLHKTLTADDTKIQTAIDPYSLAGDVTASDGTVYHNFRIGSIEIYSDTADPFTLSIFLYNTKRGRIAWQKTIEESLEGGSSYYASSDDWAYEGDVIDETFGRYMEGYIGFGTALDEVSGRYIGMVDVYAGDNVEMNTNGQYIIGVLVQGKEGQRIDMYCDGNYMALTDNDIAGWDDGMFDGTISDIATGQSTICVGAYNTREYFPALDGSMYYYGDNIFPEGAVTAFTSYGTLLDGRTLPHILAPGASIISSTSSQYHKYNNLTADKNFSAKTDALDRESQYMQTTGTSMASPMVVGTIALWLQADPTLTVEEVKEILESTAVKDKYTAAAPAAQVGWGKLDAYAGLKKVLLSGVGNVNADSSDVVVTPVGDRSFNVWTQGGDRLDAELYNIAGVRVLAASSTSGSLDIDASSVAPGVYILRVNGGYSQRVLVK